MADEQRVGPAFDTNVLSRPTQRKLVGCWMESAELPTLILPQVWIELTFRPSGMARFTPASAWERVARLSDTPYIWLSLTEDQADAALEIRKSFTQACFPNVPSDRIALHGDAIIVSEAVVLGTDLLVAGDIRSIDHYEVNDVIRKIQGRNSSFVVTLDNALMQAYPGGELGEEMLVMAMATIAPSDDRCWPVEAAYESLTRLRTALTGANMLETSMRLLTRWQQCADLESMLHRAAAMAERSKTIQLERERTLRHGRHRHAAVCAPTENAPTPRRTA